MRLPLNTMTIAASPWSCGQAFPQELWESCGFHQAISGLRAQTVSGFRARQYRDFGRTDHRQVSAQTANRRRLRTLKQSLNLLLLRASVVGRDAMKRPPIEEASHDRLAPQSRVRRRPDDSRIAFCRCAGMPKSAPHCDRRRRHGPARVRSGQRANARLPSRFAAPDIWTSYARNNGVNEQHGDPLIRRGSHDWHIAGTARLASGAPCSAWDRYR
jgi:hypothetical protein